MGWGEGGECLHMSSGDGPASPQPPPACTHIYNPDLDTPAGISFALVPPHRGFEERCRAPLGRWFGPRICDGHIYVHVHIYIAPMVHVIAPWRPPTLFDKSVATRRQAAGLDVGDPSLGSRTRHFLSDPTRREWACEFSGPHFPCMSVRGPNR